MSIILSKGRLYSMSNLLYRPLRDYNKHFNGHLQHLSHTNFSSSCKNLQRINQFGIQYLSEGLHKKIFPKTSPREYLKHENPHLLNVAAEHLNHHGLLGKKTLRSDPIEIDNFPNLVGNNTLDEHFFKIGLKSSEPYLSMCNSFFSHQIPQPPLKWVFKPGWYRYEVDKDPEPVRYPLEKELTFDVEVLHKKSPYPVIATAVSSKAWYGWVSPFLVSYKRNQTYDDWEHLIPMNTLKEERVILGHNVSYDRARILEEYNLKQSKAFFLDTMSLHVAISGLCSNQRPLWHKHNTSGKKLKEEEELFTPAGMENPDFMGNMELMEDHNQELQDDPWLAKGSPNSLANVAEFHCGIKLDKSTRNAFDTLDPMDIINDFDNLMDYCCQDVAATFEVGKKLFPTFRQKVPHPVSFAALRHLGTLVLPTTKKWENYIQTAELIYQNNRESVTNILKDRVDELVAYIIEDKPELEPDFQNDPWLKQLDWTIKEPRLKKDGTPVAKQAFLTGFPGWYRELFKTISDPVTGEKIRELNISVRTRVTPLLLRLKWEGHSLFWTESNGWCFKVPYDEVEFKRLESKNYIVAKLTEEEQDLHHDELKLGKNGVFELFKVPHPDGNSKRCTAIMSKSYSKFFLDGTLTSEYTYAEEILELNSTASYWMGNRARILDQFVVYSNAGKNKNSFFNTKKESMNHQELGMILPKLVSMGTITRRATENTWLTASNAKKNRIGSELKSLIEAPPGYTFVGADVDSEELWIAALLGDSIFKVHGSTALSWMTLEGNKNDKTDLHSKTAEILGISRGDAKIFNYGRIYGAGVRYATSLLKQCNSKLSDKEAQRIAKRLYAETKGEMSNSKMLNKKVYYGGTESFMFNALENIANLSDPRTPVLGASITEALTAANLNKNSYITSRTNWTIQSSGVDYLHLLIVSMEYLINKYKVDARLMITVHDELRYLVKEEDRYKIALLLQISNLWTRAMFVERLGFKELPQSVAFFSEVDIDKVLRKEVTLDCVTPSQPNSIPPGESLDIYKLLEKVKDSSILSASNSNGVNKMNDEELMFRSNPKVIERITEGVNEDMKLALVKLQASTDKDEWKQNILEYARLKKRHELRARELYDNTVVSNAEQELMQEVNSWNPTPKRFKVDVSAKTKFKGKDPPAKPLPAKGRPPAKMGSTAARPAAKSSAPTAGAASQVGTAVSPAKLAHLKKTNAEPKFATNSTSFNIITKPSGDKSNNQNKASSKYVNKSAFNASRVNKPPIRKPVRPINLSNLSEVSPETKRRHDNRDTTVTDRRSIQHQINTVELLTMVRLPPRRRIIAK